MIDLHCHILPGVDDGSASLADSLAMAKLAAANRTHIICATPHFNPDCGEEELKAIDNAYRTLTAALIEKDIPLKLYLGMELFSDDGLVSLLEHRWVLPLAGTSFLLTEFNFGISEERAEDLLDTLCSFGYRPVIAHPERYEFVQRRPEVLAEWCSVGYTLQLNKGSFAGRFGHAAQATAHWAVREGTVHLIASDAHGPYRRTPSFSDVAAYLSDVCFPELTDFLLEENPARLLRGETPLSVADRFPLNGD